MRPHPTPRVTPKAERIDSSWLAFALSELRTQPINRCGMLDPGSKGRE